MFRSKKILHGVNSEEKINSEMLDAEKNSDMVSAAKLCSSKSIYECPVCGQRFLTEERFLKHIEIDEHRQVREKKP